MNAVYVRNARTSGNPERAARIKARAEEAASRGSGSVHGERVPTGLIRRSMVGIPVADWWQRHADWYCCADGPHRGQWVWIAYYTDAYDPMMAYHERGCPGGFADTEEACRQAASAFVSASTPLAAPGRWLRPVRPDKEAVMAKIVSRHPAAVQFIRSHDARFADAEALASATADDVRGAIVAGNLPFHLAALCLEVVAVEFAGPAPRGAE